MIHVALKNLHDPEICSTQAQQFNHMVQRVPLAEVDVNTGHGQRVCRVGVSCHDGDVVVGKADCQVGQRAGVDHADPVRLARLHSHVLTLAPYDRSASDRPLQSCQNTLVTSAHQWRC